MARTGLTRADVKTSRDRLVAQGRYPSVDAVRLDLGNTGSKSTIHRYLKELGSEEQHTTMPRADTARTLHGLVEQLAATLHEEAEQRIQALRAEHEQALRARDAELEALRARVALLTARLDELEGRANEPPPLPDHGGRADLGAAGFGVFGDLLANPRGGRRDASPFSIMLTSGRSDVFDKDKLRPAGLKFQ
jgi:hypothetical protein